MVFLQHPETNFVASNQSTDIESIKPFITFLMPFGSSVGEGIFYVMEVELAVNILQIVIVDECPQ